MKQSSNTITSTAIQIDTIILVHYSKIYNKLHVIRIYCRAVILDWSRLCRFGTV